MDSLSSTLSSGAKLYTDSTDPQFVEHFTKWSDYGVKTPRAVVVVDTVQDVVETVCSLSRHRSWSLTSPLGLLLHQARHPFRLMIHRS